MGEYVKLIKEKDYEIKNMKIVKEFCRKYGGIRWYRVEETVEMYGVNDNNWVDKNSIKYLLENLIGNWKMRDEIKEIVVDEEWGDEEIEDEIRDIIWRKEFIIDFICLFIEENGLALVGEYSDIPEEYEIVECEEDE